MSRTQSKIWYSQNKHYFKNIKLQLVSHSHISHGRPGKWLFQFLCCHKHFHWTFQLNALSYRTSKMGGFHTALIGKRALWPHIRVTAATHRMEASLDPVTMGSGRAKNRCAFPVYEHIRDEVMIGFQCFRITCHLWGNSSDHHWISVTMCIFRIIGHLWGNPLVTISNCGSFKRNIS